MTISFGKTLQGGNIYISDQTYVDLAKRKLRSMDQVFIYEPDTTHRFLFSEKPVEAYVLVKHLEGEEGIIHPGKIGLVVKAALYYDGDLRKDIQAIQEELKKEIFAQTGTEVAEVQVLVTKLIRFRKGL